MGVAFTFGFCNTSRLKTHVFKTHATLILFCMTMSCRELQNSPTVLPMASYLLPNADKLPNEVAVPGPGPNSPPDNHSTRFPNPTSSCLQPLQPLLMGHTIEHLRASFSGVPCFISRVVPCVRLGCPRPTCGSAPSSRASCGDHG